MGPVPHPKELVPFGKGFALRRQFTEEISTRDLPYAVEIEIALEGDRLVCETFRAKRKKGGPPVTSEGIRKLPVRSLIRLAATKYVYRVRKGPRGSRVSPARLGGFERFAAAGPTDEALEYVALVYRLAFACNENPTQAVTEAFQLARSTAERWVSRARDLGLIDTPDPRRRS